MALTLRVKAKNGQHILNRLTLESTLEELKNAISELTKIPGKAVKILSGYPPKPMDVSDNSKSLSSLLLRSGETLIVEEDTKHRAEEEEKRTHNLLQEIQCQLEAANGLLLRHIVPANNSCLFTSVHFVMNGGKQDLSAASAMRQLIAQYVRDDSTYYNSAFLGKPNKEYCAWISDDNSWGGGIELSILCKYYGREIAIVDTQTIRIDKFGEDQGYSERVFLIYDGIHYDALFMEPFDQAGGVEVVFSTKDDAIMIQALDLAKEAQSSRQFTDTTHFSLRCLICNKCLTGQTEAQGHAKDTGHMNFGEV